MDKQRITATTARKNGALTGPDFAHAHGDDSSTWTAADMEAAQNLAANDLHIAWTHLPPRGDGPRPE